MATGFLPDGAEVALDALGAAYPWVQMHMGDPGAAGIANPAAETTRVQATWAAASGGTLASSVDTGWTAVAATETWTHFTAHSAATGGTIGFTGTVSNGSVTASGDAVIAAGDLTASVTLAS